MRDPFPECPKWAHFRWHTIPALICGFLLAGFDLLDPGYLTKLHKFIGLSSYMEWGVWVTPLNSILLIGIPILILATHLVKYTWLRHFRMLSYWQIGIWWLFWGMFGLAYRYGEYIGP